MLARLWRSTFGLVVLVALAFSAATVAIGAIAYEVTHEALEEQLDHRIAVETRALVAEAREGGIAAVTMASINAVTVSSRPASRASTSRPMNGVAINPGNNCATSSVGTANGVRLSAVRNMRVISDISSPMVESVIAPRSSQPHLFLTSIACIFALQAPSSTLLICTVV